MGTAFSLATCGVSHGMSEFFHMTMEPLWPESSDPGTVLLYKITAYRSGQGLLKVELSSDGLPEGATVSFTPSTLRFTGRVPTTRTAIMAINCAEVTATDTYEFTITGEARRQTITLTNEVTLSSKAVEGLPVLYVDPLPENTVKIRGLGSSGQTYQIESTPDLANPVWTPIGSTTADGNGRFIFFVPEIDASPMKFFRAVYPMPEPALPLCSGLPKP